jgi:hypothetical protein
MDVGVPQRIVGVEDQMERPAVADPFMRVGFFRIRRRIGRSPMRLAKRAMP